MGRLHCDPSECVHGECEECQKAQRAFADVVTVCCWCGGAILKGNEVYGVSLAALAAVVGRDLYRHLRSRESNLMHERCWDECTVALDLSPDEAERVATLVVAGDESVEDEVELAWCESCGAEVAADELIETDCGHKVCSGCLIESPSGQTACELCLSEGWVVTTRSGFRRVTPEEEFCPPPRSA